MPAYNEAENIAEVVSEWHPIIESLNKSGNNDDSRLVIFNDGSKDDTLSVLESLKESYPYLVVVDKKNSGHGDTLIHAYKYALDHDADYIFQTDSDGQTAPTEFDQFWQQRTAYDAIIGSRTHRQDGASRVFVTKTLKAVVKHSFGVECEDANTPFRLMSSNTLAKNLAFVPDGYNLTNVLLSVIYLKSGQRVKFIPITFKPRQGGVNSINLKSITKIGIQAVKDFKELNDTVIQGL